MTAGRGAATLLALALSAVSVSQSAPKPGAGSGPSLVIPSRPDTALRNAPESPPAPLLVPGRTAFPDTMKKTPAERARETFRLGLELERRNQPAAAIAAYQSAIAFDLKIPEANYRAGLLFLTRDQVAPAVRHFSAEVVHHPEHIGAERELGMGLARLGDTTQAIVRLEALTKRVPTDDQTWHALAFAYSVAGRTPQAEAALRQALVLAPPRAIEHRDLAVLLAQNDRDREAREEYRKALELDAGDPSVWYNLGNLDRRAGDLKRALKSFRTAEAKDSNFTLALLGQVTVLKQLGRDREVGTTYRRWLARKPGDHDTRIEAVRFFAAQGQSKTGVALARDAVKELPRSGDAHLVLGVALDLNGQSRAALAELRTAESLFRDQESLAQARHVIADLRSRAPDSLQAHFHADSVAHAAGAP